MEVLHYLLAKEKKLRIDTQPQVCVMVEASALMLNTMNS